MLQINEDAENTIRRIRETNDVPRSAVLRIAPVRTIGDGVGIGFAFTDGPEEGDQMISEKPDFIIYLAPELADSLETATLKATNDAEGIELELRTQAELHDHGSNGDSTLPRTLGERRLRSVH